VAIPQKSISVAHSLSTDPRLSELSIGEFYSKRYQSKEKQTKKINEM
jgi:hypothetical protein